MYNARRCRLLDQKLRYSPQDNFTRWIALKQHGRRLATNLPEVYNVLLSSFRPVRIENDITITLVKCSITLLRNFNFLKLFNAPDLAKSGNKIKRLEDAASIYLFFTYLPGAFIFLTSLNSVLQVDSLNCQLTNIR